MSELEHFLHQSLLAGSHDSEGEFSLAREKRLAKLAEFQLPYASACAVKMIQAAVCTGHADEIKVTLSRKEARFSHSGTWEVDEFEAGFFEPELVREPHLRHLLQALWPVALAQQRPFLASFRGAAEALYWDGETLQRTAQSPKVRSAVTVSHQPIGVSLSSFERSRRNADLALTLQQKCFSSPVPLWVDGRRVDSLLHCPHFGWGGKACPLGIAFPQADIPSLSFPLGTFDSVASSKILDSEPVEDLHETGFLKIGRANLREIKGDNLGEFAFLVALNSKMTHSTLFWVLDGVVVDSDIVCQKTECAVGCYVSAQGMETDLTSLHLLHSDERKRILDRAQKATLAYLRLRPQSIFPIGTLESKVGLVDTVVGMGTIFSASLLFFTPPPVGAFLFLGALGASLKRIVFAPSSAHFKVLGEKFSGLLDALAAP